MFGLQLQQHRELNGLLYQTNHLNGVHRPVVEVNLVLMDGT